MKYPGTLSPADKEHLNRVASNMNWTLIAGVMQALKWQWYHIKGRTPNAGELRDEATARLADAIHEARTNGLHSAATRSGGLEYVASTCDETGDVLSLYCAFVLDSWESNDATTCRFPGD